LLVGGCRLNGSSLPASRGEVRATDHRQPTTASQPATVDPPRSRHPVTVAYL
jgi:hypothetical protein